MASKQQSQAEIDLLNETKKKYEDAGLTNVDQYVTKGKFDEVKAQTDVIKNIYKLDPANYTDKKGVLDFAKATTKYQYELPKLTYAENAPSNFTQAVNNYSRMLAQAQRAGVTNLNTLDQKALMDAAKIVRDFDSKDLSENAKQIITNVTEASDAINAINDQRKTVQIQQYRANGFDADGVTKIKISKKELEAARGRLVTEQDTLRRLESTVQGTAPKLSESLTRFGLADIGVGTQSRMGRIQGIESGLASLGAGQVFEGGGLAGRLNVNVTDDQIINDINEGRKNQYKSLYETGSAIVVDIQSQLAQANQFLSDLPAGDSRRSQVQKTIDGLNSQLESAQNDSIQAKNLYDNYTPLSGSQATSAISSFREKLRLPEERTLQQIESIDPTLGSTVRALSKGYQTMAETPVGPTTTEQTEQLRNQIEQEALNQLKLGSTIGAEERRGYEQAIRSAQAARGNVAGVAPAVEEAASIGAAAEQRKLQRYGAAAQVLGSGETTGGALARDVALRDALNQSRLGAASGFVAGGPNAYNLASQRLAQQQNVLMGYLGASSPQGTGQFQATASQASPYAYVDPMAGFRGAQNAANIYGSIADYQARTYGAYTSAQATTNAANSLPNYLSAGADLLKGVGSLGGGAGLFACWVAREVYGADNPKWVEFREWMFTKASDNLRNFYLKYGERIAESIRNKPKIKSIIRKWMDSKIG